MMKQRLRKKLIGASLICLLSSFGCGGGGGGSASNNNADVSNEDTLSVQGKLAQGYVRSAQVWFDRFSADGIGNFQRDPGEPDTLSGSDGSFQLSIGEGAGMLISTGGTYLNSAGQAVEASPMLAPKPVQGQTLTDINITPITTLVAFEPSLKDALESYGDWNADIASDDGISAPLLRIAKTVEGLSETIGQVASSEQSRSETQLRSIEVLASQLSNLSVDGLASGTSLTSASSGSLDLILDNQTLVKPLGINVRNQIQNSMNNLVLEITKAIPEDGEVVESEVVSVIEEKRAEGQAAIENELDQQVTISIGGFGLEFDPIISKITLQLTDGILYISGEASDERPSTLSYRWDTSPALSLIDRFSANSRLENFDNTSLTVIWRVTDDTESRVTEYCTWDNSSNPTICEFLSR